MIYEPYKRFIENEFTIINKNGDEVPFVLNPVQERFVQDAENKNVVLKARQQGFSSFILAAFTADFLLKPNSRSIVVADIDENAQELLDRVKHYIKSYERKNGVKVPLKYDSKKELFNESMNSRYSIGTAKSTEFGRSKTITNLHLSEAAFYPSLSGILKGAGNALVPNGRLIMETTANGYNEFKQVWDKAVLTGSYKPLFYKASDFYSPEELEKKRGEAISDKDFMQEYPETPQEAFQASGNPYFDQDAMGWYLEQIQEMKNV